MLMFVIFRANKLYVCLLLKRTLAEPPVGRRTPSFGGEPPTASRRISFKIHSPSVAMAQLQVRALPNGAAGSHIRSPVRIRPEQPYVNYGFGVHLTITQANGDALHLNAL